MINAKRKYNDQKSSAKRRGIEWRITFEEWCEWWVATGHWDQRSRTGYVMARYGDKGAYELGNIYCTTAHQNVHDMHVNGRANKDTTSAALANKKPILTPYGVFESGRLAAAALGVHEVTIYRRVRRNAPGYRWL